MKIYARALPLGKSWVRPCPPAYWIPDHHHHWLTAWLSRLPGSIPSDPAVPLATVPAALTALSGRPIWPAAGGGTGQAAHRPSMAALTTATDWDCCRCRQSCCARAPVWPAGWVSPSHRRRRTRGLCPSACLERLSTRVRSVLWVPSSEICSCVYHRA